MRWSLLLLLAGCASVNVNRPDRMVCQESGGVWVCDSPFYGDDGRVIVLDCRSANASTVLCRASEVTIPKLGEVRELGGG